MDFPLLHLNSNAENFSSRSAIGNTGGDSVIKRKLISKTKYILSLSLQNEKGKKQRNKETKKEDEEPCPMIFVTRRNETLTRWVCLMDATEQISTFWAAVLTDLCAEGRGVNLNSTVVCFVLPDWKHCPACSTARRLLIRKTTMTLSWCLVYRVHSRW